jgi:signal transduction histidine kinase
VREVLEQAIDIVRPAAAANGIPIELHVEGDAVVLMDPQRLMHAFENVITNATQHSTRDSAVGVTMRVGLDDVEVVVRDSGPGFREEDLSRIFEPFFTRRRGGTGLGLSVVQRVVDEHGGTVTAGNGSPNGAVVTIKVPRYDHSSTAGELGTQNPHR